jgi:hypothetical protein
MHIFLPAINLNTFWKTPFLKKLHKISQKYLHNYTWPNRFTIDKYEEIKNNLSILKESITIDFNHQLQEWNKKQITLNIIKRENNITNNQKLMINSILG